MKKLVLIMLAAMAINTTYAQKYFTKTGTTDFKASVDTFEPVEAINRSTTAILNTANGEVAVLLFVNAFQFKIALMQEHFNENYMLSNTFPKSNFKGKLRGFKFRDLKTKPKQYIVSGKLTIKGVSQPLNIPVNLSKSGNTIIVDSHFSIDPKTYAIEIPNAVENKIAKNVTIKLHYELIKKK